MEWGEAVLGMLCWSQKERLRLEYGPVDRLTVLCAQVRPGGWMEGRRLDRAARMLAGQGVRRMLPVRDGPEPGRQGLTAVDPTPLYRTMAAPLTMAALTRQGSAPHRACVALRGIRAEGDLTRAAMLLCPQVRELVIDVPQGGERLARKLYWEFGLAVCLERGQGADLSVRFDGLEGEGLGLYGPDPELLGLGLACPSAALPESLEPLPALTALWQAGLMKAEELEVTF